MSGLDDIGPGWKPYAAAAAIALIGGAAGYGLSSWQAGGAGQGGPSTAKGCKEVLYWYDPMAPDRHFDAPGKSPFMDMQLLPKCADEGTDGGAGVRIDPAIVQNLGIRTAKAEYGALEMEMTLPGVLAYNGSEVAIVQPRTGGFVQRTYGHAPQDVVARGAPIADLLVPEWGGAQQEYLAIVASGDTALANAARERMRLLGMSDAVIASVARSGRPHSTITITAPQAGAITMLGVRPGMSVSAGQTLAEISGYSPIWLEAAVPEAQAGEVRIGQSISAVLTAFPGEAFTGRIIAILPAAQDATRTITVRAALPNPRLLLQPGMFAQVSLSPEQRESLLVPSEAIIRTGERTLLMIAQKNGGYLPAEIEIGREANGRTQVLAGLAEGERVVTSGQFLLDSEASLSGIEIRGLDEAPSAPSQRSKRQ